MKTDAEKETACVENSIARLREYLRGGEPYDNMRVDIATLTDAHRKSLPIIRGAIMLLVELREAFVPKEGHWNKHINARIDSLKSRLP